jgi:hypothetical protein
MARLGQHHFPGGSVDQPDAGLLLKLFHTVTDRRLAQADNLACTAKTFRLRDGDKYTQLS